MSSRRSDGRLPCCSVIGQVVGTGVADGDGEAVGTAVSVGDGLTTATDADGEAEGELGWRGGRRRDLGARGDERRDRQQADETSGRVARVGVQLSLRRVGKTRSYAATSSGPSWSAGTCRWSASHAPVTRTHSGSFRDRGAPGGARKGESVSISTRSAGTSAATSADASSPAPKDEPREADGEPEVDDLPAVVERAGVRVDHRRRPLPERGAPAGVADARRAELRDEGVLRVAPAVGRAAMEDRRLAGLEREGKVPAQVDGAGPRSG